MTTYLGDFFPHYSPDGLTESTIDALLAEIDTALVDGTARTQRARRQVQRQLGATVRVLRVHQPVDASAGTEAA